MTKLSIIIVSYNVKYFLEQTLFSVRNAGKHIHPEVFVIDNHSSDGSADMVREKFPEVRLMENEKNVGFSKANNQAIKVAAGEYILLLNPDTLLQEDTLDKTVQFMDEHPDAGALGVKMLDGKGNFLRESKRGLPTPAVAFFKVFGISGLFPKSRVFGRYHLGYLDEDETNEVDVLPGAFMLLRKEVLDEIGLLDETFFMYGEDIDLSYRVTEAGYKNYYYPETRIIHYKGESTKKGSLNYVRMFYNAMGIFAKKHFSPQQARLYSFLITVAIYFRAVLAFVKRFVQKAYLPVIDAGLLYGGMFAIKTFWATNIKNAPEYYPKDYMLYVVPAYIVVWLVTVFFSGGYDKPLKTSRLVRGLIIGTVLIAAFYGFLPETLRFSRAMILLGAVWAIFSMVGFRLVLKMLLGKKLDLEDAISHRMVIVGGHDEAKRTLSLLSQSGGEYKFMGFVTPNGQNEEADILGTLDELPDIREIYDVDEIIFCSKDIPAQKIIASMVENGPELNYKIVPEKGMSVIGSNSKDSAGDLYAIDINLAISTPMNKRNKRMFDLLLCGVTLITFPILILIINNRSGFIKNWFSVLTGKKTWVGYEKAHLPKAGFMLPKIKDGALSPLHALKNRSVNEATQARLNLLYAKDYSVYSDLNIVWKGMKELGTSS